jgi:hypothetical protein
MEALSRLPSEFGKLYLDEEMNKERMKEVLEREKAKMKEDFETTLIGIKNVFEDFLASCDTQFYQQYYEFERNYGEFKSRVDEQYEFDRVAEREQFASPVELMDKSTRRGFQRQGNYDNRVEGLKELEYAYKVRVAELNKTLYNEYIDDLTVMANKLRHKLLGSYYDAVTAGGYLREMEEFIGARFMNKEELSCALVRDLTQPIEVAAAPSQKVRPALSRSGKTSAAVISPNARIYPPPPPPSLSQARSPLRGNDYMAENAVAKTVYPFQSRLDRKSPFKHHREEDDQLIEYPDDEDDGREIVDDHQQYEETPGISPPREKATKLALFKSR